MLISYSERCFRQLFMTVRKKLAEPVLTCLDNDSFQSQFELRMTAWRFYVYAKAEYISVSIAVEVGSRSHCSNKEMSGPAYITQLTTTTWHHLGESSLLASAFTPPLPLSPNSEMHPHARRSDMAMNNGKRATVGRGGCPRYPKLDTAELRAWDELLGIELEIDPEQVSQQRETLQRINSERFHRNKSYNQESLSISERGVVGRSFSMRSLPSTQSSVSEDHQAPISQSCATSHALESSFNGPPTVETTHATSMTLKESNQRNNRASSARHLGGGHRDLRHGGLPPPISRDHSRSCSWDDRVGHLPNGKRVNIKGASHVYSEILKGSAVLVQCPSCDTVVQVGKKTINVLCPVCKTVSPVSATMSRINSTQLDGEIASVVQEQECDVARVRLQAKLAGGGRSTY